MATILIDKLLQTVISQGASDLHISVGQPPVLRLHGHMRKVETKSLEPEDTVALMKQITPERCQQSLQEVGGADFGFAFGDQARFRVSIFKQRSHVGMVLRIIPNNFMSIEQLGLPWPCVELVKRPRGLFLVTGPTGSGKSTSLASLINHLNETVDHHIITIEDPIEFLHRHKRCLVNQREIGPDAISFSDALLGALRQDPDVILLGEMRDLETISTALTAAETGHLVFGTLHTQDAPSTVDRLIDVFPPAQQEQIRIKIASTLQAVVTQALVPTVDGQGRIPAVEILFPDDAVRNLIRQAKVEQIYSIMQTGTKRGMQTLEQALADLVMRGKISQEAAVTRSSRPEQFLGLLKRAGFGGGADETPVGGLRVAGA